LRVLFLVLLKEGAQLEIVLCVQARLHRDVVLDQFEELFFETIQLVGHEERVDEGEVGVAEIAIIPNFLGYEERAEDEGPPVGGLKRNFCERDQSIDVDQTNYAAFGPAKRQGCETSARVNCVRRLTKIWHSRRAL